MIKKLVIALAAVLLLTGCGAAPEVPETTAPPVETTMPTEPVPSCYVENSPMERGTGGAVRQYELDAPVTGLASLDGQLLVCTGSNTLTLFDSATLQVLRSRELDHELDWNNPSLVFSENGMGFYDEDCQTYLTLDNSLITASTYVGENDMLAQSVISGDFSRIYYAAENGIRVLQLSDGTSRLIREEHKPILSVGGMLFNDSTLYYTRLTEDGVAETCFVDVDNGSLYQTADFQGQVLSWDRNYVGRMVLDHALGQTTWLISGDLQGNLRRLAPNCTWEDALLLPNGWAVLQQSSRVGVTLYCYDMADGTFVSQITMPEQYELLTHAAATGSKIWLTDSQGTRFYCWDTSVSGGAGAESVFADYASMGMPDENGLAQCGQLAQTIGDRHGVKITVREENNRTAGVDYSTYPDYRSDMYMLALRELERVMKDLPQDFLKKVGRLTDAGRLEIRLVDDYDPDRKSTPATGYIDVADGNAAICVSICGNIREIFFHELFHMMEVQFMNNGDGFKNWDDVNPKNFNYANSYSDYYEGKLNKSSYLSQGSSFFADAYGLISPREDRAQVFLYACLDGESGRFASPGMQGKLSMICQVIREHVSLSSEEMPIWEQYLFPGESTEETRNPET